MTAPAEATPPSLPATVHASFQVAATELGMWSAARLFCRELHEEGGAALVARLRDELGRDYPVLDGVAASFDPGAAPPSPAALDEALAGIDRVLVCGLEAFALDALAAHLDPRVELGVVTGAGVLEPDWDTALSNYTRSIARLGLADFQGWAGRRSALVTFVYGHDGALACVGSAWMRLHAPDVRAQFRALVGWSLLARPLELYPRWLSQTSVSDFSHLVGP